MKILLTLALATLLMTTGSAAAAERKPQAEPASSTEPAAAKKIDVNRATKEELLSVPGIGPGMAQGILDLRAKKGSFGRLEELLEVRGIKTKKLESLGKYLVVAPIQQANSTLKQ